MTEPQSASLLLKALAFCTLAGPILGVVFRHRLEPEGDGRTKVVVGLIVGLGMGFGAGLALVLLAVILS
jgi:hypothetical protein